jgi:hypothetical protein
MIVKVVKVIVVLIGLDNQQSSRAFRPGFPDSGRPREARPTFSPFRPAGRFPAARPNTPRAAGVRPDRTGRNHRPKRAASRTATRAPRRPRGSRGSSTAPGTTNTRRHRPQARKCQPRTARRTTGAGAGTKTGRGGNGEPRNGPEQDPRRHRPQDRRQNTHRTPDTTGPTRNAGPNDRPEKRQTNRPTGGSPPHHQNQNEPHTEPRRARIDLIATICS